jgi:hypothetical protein
MGHGPVIARWSSVSAYGGSLSVMTAPVGDTHGERALLMVADVRADASLPREA